MRMPPSGETKYLLILILVHMLLYVLKKTQCNLDRWITVNKDYLVADLNCDIKGLNKSKEKTWTWSYKVESLQTKPDRTNVRKSHSNQN